ncbi:MAG: hypothetical protein FWF60_07980 [Oscillospiraceae bacterium]|nr:hypothetical protein [Oscillospiraceae bacterium]
MDEDELYDYDDEPERVIGRCEDCLWVEDCPDASGGEGCDDFTERWT